MLEKQIERYLKEEVQARGWLCWKLVSPGTTGVPDRIVRRAEKAGYRKSVEGAGVSDAPTFRTGA